MSNDLQEIEICSFCGTHKDQRKKLIVSGDVAICDYCTNLCHDLIINNNTDNNYQNFEDSNFHIDALSIYEHLNEHVIGQNDAKIALSVAIANHYKRIYHPPDDLVMQKGNILMIGPTGSGKTLLAKVIAKMLNVPFVVVDATSLTEAGYVGDDVDTMISMLLREAGGSVSLAEKGIIFLDEVDKITRKSESPSITRDVSGEGVQQALLKLVEGAKCKVNVNGIGKNLENKTEVVDTQNILFIAGGAFVGLNDIIKRRMHGGSLGFTSTVQSDSTHTRELFYNKVTPDDLVKYGLIPEFVGRFSVNISLNALNKDELLKVMVNVKNNFIDQYKYLFSLDDIDLEFEQEALEKMIDNCFELRTGARGIQNELEHVLMPHMFYITDYKKKGITKINITKDLVEKPKKIVYE